MARVVIAVRNLYQSLVPALVLPIEPVADTHLHGLIFLELGRRNFLQRFNFVSQVVGGKNAQPHRLKNDFGKFVAVFRLAVADEFYFWNDAGTVCAGDVVTDLPFEVMVFAERSF